MAGAVLAADPKDDLKAAIKKLSDAPNYSFSMTTTNAGGGFGGGRGGGRGGMNAPLDGKVSEGIAYASRTTGDTTSEAVAKGAKRAIKTDEGWQTTEEMMAGGGGFGGGGGRGAFGMMGLVVPAVQADELLAKTKDLKFADGVYSGTLTEDGAKAFVSPFPARGGGEGPDIAGAKGSVKFWVKDGTLSKYEMNVQGKMSFGDNEIQMDRTATVDVKDVGTTKVTIPDAAKKKVS